MAINNEEQKKPLSREETKKVNGGYIYIYCNDDDPDRDWYTWEVIDDKDGKVIKYFNTPDEAEEYAQSIGMSTRYLSWPELSKLRGQ